MKQDLTRWACLVLVIFSSGCATILGDSEDQIEITSEPSGASVISKGMTLGKTPLKVSLPRETQASYLTFKKEGYEEKTINLQKNIAGAAWVNLAFITTTFGATSWGIDVATGKMWRYTNRAYAVELDVKGKKTALLPEDQRPLAFLAESHGRVVKELAQNNESTFQDLCRRFELSAEQCVNWRRESVPFHASWASTQDGLELYRALKKSLQTVL